MRYTPTHWSAVYVAHLQLTLTTANGSILVGWCIVYGETEGEKEIRTNGFRDHFSRVPGANQAQNQTFNGVVKSVTALTGAPQLTSLIRTPHASLLLFLVSTIILLFALEDI